MNEALQHLVSGPGLGTNVTADLRRAKPVSGATTCMQTPSYLVRQVPFSDVKAQYQPIRDEILAAVTTALDHADPLDRPNANAFEAEFAAYCQTRYAVGVGSGTDALYLALRACGIRSGDEVITVANSFIGTTAAVVLLGAVPVYVDIDPVTYTLDPNRVEAAISPRTRAIIPVHLYGQMADMDALHAIAQRHGLVVIENACQAHGAEDKGRPAGSLGDVAAFSFSISKMLGTHGDAGAITTNSRAVAEQVRLLRDHGAVSAYHHQETGISSHLGELEAAVLRVKLRYLNCWNERRHSHVRLYSELLADAGVQVPIARSGTRHAYHLYAVQVGDRKFVQQALAQRGIATAVHYPVPLHQQPAISEIGRLAGDLCVTEVFAATTLSLPLYPELTEEQLRYVVSCLRACLGAL